METFGKIEFLNTFVPAENIGILLEARVLAFIGLTKE